MVRWKVSSKNIFSKSLIFEISKILIFNPKSVNLYFLWLVNHFSIRLVNRALINRFLTTLGAYSDSRSFFQYEISPLFSTVFQKVDGRRRRYAIVISNSHVYITITGVSFVRTLMIQCLIKAIDKFNILRIWVENVNFIIFHFLGKRSDMENRLHRLYCTWKFFGIGYDLNWRYYSTPKSTAFTEISHF